jgi:hypothetical protein
MTEEAAMPPPPAYPDIDEIEHSVFGFYSEEWEDIPYPSGPDWFSEEERARRNTNADKYQQCGGDPTLWYGYLHLGFFVFEDCSDFEKAWFAIDDDPLTVHKIIWYQFLYHMDRRFPIPDKLQRWATDVSHPFLSYYDPTALTVDTGYPYHAWQLFVAEENTHPMEVDQLTDAEQQWNEVDKKGRTRSKSPSQTKANMSTTLSIPGWTKEPKKRPITRHSTTQQQMSGHTKSNPPTSWSSQRLDHHKLQR